MNSDTGSDFSKLSPDFITNAVAKAYSVEPTGLLNPFPSYINRVYEMQMEDGSLWVCKFYRPGRWTEEALLEEHEFLLDCDEAEIPVVLPVETSHGASLSKAGDFYFALFPKKGGRLLELNTDEDYLRVGRLLGRIHAAGSLYNADQRFILKPEISAPLQLEEILSKGGLSPAYQRQLTQIVEEALKWMAPLFKDMPLIRCHGDFHRGNILERPGSGLMVIDFDDMMMAPPAQDLWMLLPGKIQESGKEWSLLVEGYSEFSLLPQGSRALVESLRFLRMLYFQSWCARQKDDHSFFRYFPDWGSPHFWEKEIKDFSLQIEEMTL